MSSHITRVGDVTTDLGECPLWNEGSGQLWFMDCRRGLIHRMAPDGGAHQQVAVPPPAGSFAFNSDGRLVVALKEELALVDPSTGALERIARLDETHPDLRFNDGTPLADGGFLVGTMHPGRPPGEEPLGGLYRQDPGAGLRKLDRGFGVVNGPRVGPLDGRLYVCDSAQRTIYSYAFTPDGGLADRRTFVVTGAFESAPDGCAFDEDGGLWTALVQAGALARFGVDGCLTHRIDLPLAHPTALCFGGPDMTDIFVTSIRDSGRLKSDGPHDGALLLVRGAGCRGYSLPRCGLGG